MKEYIHTLKETILGFLVMSTLAAFAWGIVFGIVYLFADIK
jgi:hypothetical protein